MLAREKTAQLMSMSAVDMAAYRSKRNQRSYWQRLPHEEWVEFCEKMGKWFLEIAPNERDNIVKFNKERKAANDAVALEKVIRDKIANGKK